VRFLGYNLDIYEEFEAVCVCFIVDDLVLELLNEKERVRRVALGARARFCNSGGLRLGGLGGPILISFYRTG